MSQISGKNYFQKNSKLYYSVGRVKLSEKKIILYGGNFNTTSLHNQKVDVHHKKRSKAEELGAKRLQRPKKF